MTDARAALAVPLVWAEARSAPSAPRMMMVAPDSAEMHMIMAGEFGRQGDHTNAIVQYREAVRLNPKLPGARFLLAEQLRTFPDAALNAQAEDEYKAAIRALSFGSGQPDHFLPFRAIADSTERGVGCELLPIVDSDRHRLIAAH
jgi:hypothetical protein